MSLVFRLEDYGRYLERVGEASYIDLTRRTDPARIERVWDNLRAVVETYGRPWILQLWTKDAAATLARGRRQLERLLAQGTTLTAQVTVTGLGGTRWEPLVPGGRTGPYQVALRPHPAHGAPPGPFLSPGR